jgi:hypothetical protein
MPVLCPRFALRLFQFTQAIRCHKVIPTIVRKGASPLRRQSPGLAALIALTIAPDARIRNSDRGYVVQSGAGTGPEAAGYGDKARLRGLLQAALSALGVAFVPGARALMRRVACDQRGSAKRCITPYRTFRLDKAPPIPYD